MAGILDFSCGRIGNFIWFGCSDCKRGAELCKIVLNDGAANCGFRFEVVAGRRFYNSLYNCVNSFLSFDNTSLSRTEKPFVL